MFDWNDLKYLLAVARQGTTLGASRELRVSQSTVARRVQALKPWGSNSSTSASRATS
jgi:DNA-binding transcriptional LysR family regulator